MLHCIYIYIYIYIREKEMWNKEGEMRGKVGV